MSVLEVKTKISPVLDAQSALGELYGLLGWCCEVAAGDLVPQNKSVRTQLRSIQSQLLIVQAEIAGADRSIPLLHAEQLGGLVHALRRQPAYRLDSHEFASRCSIAHGVAERASKRVEELHADGHASVSSSSRSFLQRVAALLHVLSRPTKRII